MSESFQDFFQLNKEIVYLNAAAWSPMPIASAQAGVDAITRRTARYWETNPSDFFDASERLRSKIAGLWGTMPRNIALVPSVSYGVETAVKNLRVKPGQEILVPQDDFPSDVYPWIESARRDGARLNFVHRPENGDWTSAFLACISPRTALVSVPLADWADGAYFDLKQISRRAKEAGARLIVDVSQSFGVVPFSISDFDPDFMFSVGYKWQLGPYGMAYLYVADRWLDGQPLENNWLNRRGSEDFSRLIEYRGEYQDGARRFDAGERSQFHLTPMALESMNLINELTVAAIFAHVTSLVADIYEGMQGLGFILPPAQFLAGQMLGARHRHWPDMNPLIKRLRERGVYVSARGSAMRIAPHLYNDRQDVARFLGILAGEIKS
jgi:selenocysteine lyase/cysteine desulfurase